MKCLNCKYETDNKKSMSNHLRFGCIAVKGSWEKRNRKYLLEYRKKWRRKNIKKVRIREREINRIWRNNNPQKVKLNRKKTNNKLRTDVLNAYGNKCQCCGESHREFLAIDHMNNDGTEHKKSLSLKSAQAFYTWLRKNNYPQGFQVLCHNCNMAKGFYGRCPHND